MHKVTSSLTDTQLTAKMLSPDPNWVTLETVDASGAGGKVVAFARNGRTPFQLNLQTDHPGTAQYLIAGLQSRFEYRVYRNDDGTDVTRQLVSDGDNTLYFEAPAGNYSIFPAGLSNLFLRPRPRAAVGSAFELDMRTAGTSPDFQWSLAGGALPPGLSLSAAGVISGTLSQAGTFTFTVQAQADVAPGVSATGSITIEVDPPALTVVVGPVTSGAAVITYGVRGLNALQPCTVSISSQPDFSTIAESFTDGGGAAVRWYVAGQTAALQPASRYYAQANCGPLFSTGTIAFSTLASVAPQSAPIRLSLSPPPRIAVNSVEIDYGNSPQLGSLVTVPCTGNCVAEIPATSGTIVYMKRVYLDAASRPLAASSIQPVAAGQ